MHNLFVFASVSLYLALNIPLACTTYVIKVFVTKVLSKILTQDVVQSFGVFPLGYSISSSSSARNRDCIGRSLSPRARHQQRHRAIDITFTLSFHYKNVLLTVRVIIKLRDMLHAVSSHLIKNAYIIHDSTYVHCVLGKIQNTQSDINSKSCVTLQSTHL